MPSPRVKAQCLTHWEAFSGVLSNTTLGFEAPLRPLRVCCGYTELFFFLSTYRICFFLIVGKCMMTFYRGKV